MTSLNQEMFDKVNEIFTTLFVKIRAFKKEEDFDSQREALETAFLKLKDDARTYQLLLTNDTIEILPDKIEEIQTKLAELKTVAFEQFLNTINDWDAFLVAQFPTENNGNSGESEDDENNENGDNENEDENN